MSWQKIWKSRVAPQELNNSLQNLIYLDGFDTGISRISESVWREGTIKIADKLGINNNDSIFEFGCGSGAFLKALNDYKNINGGGLDISSSLLNIAKQSLPHMNFYHEEAAVAKNIPLADFTIAHSVFQYFNLEYADRVIDNMFKNSNRALAILDIPNLEMQSQCEFERQKQNNFLSHQYYSTAWFNNQANKYNTKCEIINNHLNYPQSKFRFGCIFWK